MTVNNIWSRDSHATGNSVKHIGAPFTVFTKPHHVSSSGTVKVFDIYMYL